MTNLEKIKQIEENINYLLNVYDKADEELNETVKGDAVERIEYELEKLREFSSLSEDIQISTEAFVQ